MKENKGTFLDDYKKELKEEAEEKPKGRKKGAQAFQKRKQAPSYKIVTIRFKEEEYNAVIDKALKKYKKDYASLSDYIKSTIFKDLNI